ncbi:MAG: IclR family transcriptional regulator [Bryobacterales bacterium]|nr:IclR family transcriptional regulator [Bryobacterales bacterium]
MKRMRKTTAAAAGVRVLHKALDVIEALRSAPSGLALTDLTARLRMPKATVYRILATLESRAYLDRTGDSRYRIGRKLTGASVSGAPGQAEVTRAARPHMEALLGLCKETLNLGVLDGGEVLVVGTLESPQAVRMSSKIGNRRYPHSTALGKVLLAGLHDKEVRRVIRSLGMPAFTDRTIVSADALVVELVKVRAQGWAVDNRENEDDGRCIAAPVFGPDRAVVAALSISGPLPRMTSTRAKGFLPDLLRATTAISAALGG